jgi:hypothetical protein
MPSPFRHSVSFPRKLSGAQRQRVAVGKMIGIERGRSSRNTEPPPNTLPKAAYSGFDSARQTAMKRLQFRLEGYLNGHRNHRQPR